MPANTGQKVQARCPEAARHAESASGHRDRSPVSNGRFLRSGRCCAGQVRDASPGESGQAVSQRVRFDIRLFAPYLLSSGGRLPAGRPLRSIAREARAPARPQAHARRSRLHGSTACERSFAPRCRSGCCHPATVRYHYPSAEYRTRTGQEKKQH